MNLQTRCKSCGKFIRFRKSAADRFALERKIGGNPNLTCTYCNRTKAYNLNEIKAKPNKFLRIFALLILVGGLCTSIVFVFQLTTGSSNVNLIGSLVGLIGFPYLIYEAIVRTDQQKVYYFNAKHYD